MLWSSGKELNCRSAITAAHAIQTACSCSPSLILCYTLKSLCITAVYPLITPPIIAAMGNSNADTLMMLRFSWHTVREDALWEEIAVEQVAKAYSVHMRTTWLPVLD